MREARSGAEGMAPTLRAPGPIPPAECPPVGPQLGQKGSGAPPLAQIAMEGANAVEHVPESELIGV